MDEKNEKLSIGSAIYSLTDSLLSRTVSSDSLKPNNYPK